MTLVLTLATPDVVVQVADRRLTDLTTGGAVDDNANKSVSYCGVASFGYTGLAAIGKESTDEWLANTIAGEPAMFEVVHRLAHRANEDFRRIRVPDRRWKSHSFVGAGWGESAPGADLTPHIWCVSNCLDTDSKPIEYPTEDFRVYSDNCSDAPFVLHSVGQHIPTAQRKDLRRNIDRCLSHRTSTLSLAELMVGAVRAVAANNPAVGRGVLISAIPKVAVESSAQGVFLLASAPMAEERTFLYISESNDTAVQYAPIYACRGGVMSNFVAKPL